MSTGKIGGEEAIRSCTKTQHARWTEPRVSAQRESVAANADLKTDDTAGAQGNEDVDLLGKAWSQSARVVLLFYGKQKKKRSTRRHSWH